MNLLIVYYSWSNGNTQKIAEQLRLATGADIARIETVKPYEGSYMNVVNQGQREVNEAINRTSDPLNTMWLITMSSPSEHRPGGIRWRRL